MSNEKYDIQNESVSVEEMNNADVNQFYRRRRFRRYPRPFLPPIFYPFTPFLPYFRPYPFFYGPLYPYRWFF